MSNNAIINFLFNSQGAVNQLNDFKTKFSNVISSIEKSGIGTFGALGTSLASIFSVKSLVDHTKTIDDLHTAYSSMSLEQISLFSNLYELLGGTDEEATNLLKRTKDLIYQLDKGEAPPFLAEMGMQSRDAEGKLKDSVTFLEELREKMKTFSPDQQTRFMEQLGIYSTATKRYMNLQGEELKDYEARAKKMGVVSKESVERVREFERSIAQLRGSFRKLGDTLLKAGIGDLIDGITKAIDKFCELPEPTQQGIMLIVFALMMLKPALAITRSVYALTTALGSLIATVGLPLIGIAFLGFLIAVMFNLGGTRDALDKCLESFDKFIGELSKDHPLAASFLKQLSELAKAIIHPIRTLDDARKQWNSIWEDLEKDHSLPSEMFKTFAKMIQMVLDPMQALINTYNQVAKAMGWKMFLPERPKSKEEELLDEKLKMFNELHPNKIGIRGGVTSQAVQEAIIESSKQDNRNIDLTFNANFNGLDAESSSNIMGEFTKWGNSVKNALNTNLSDLSINFGG